MQYDHVLPYTHVPQPFVSFVVLLLARVRLSHAGVTLVFVWPTASSAPSVSWFNHDIVRNHPTRSLRVPLPVPHPPSLLMSAPEYHPSSCRSIKVPPYAATRGHPIPWTEGAPEK